MSIGKKEKFLVPDLSWERTLWGRIDQGRRELAAALGKDVTVEKLAELIGIRGPSMNGWKKGSQPKKEHLLALEKIFFAAKLYRFSAVYLDYGDGHKLSEAPPVKMKRVGED